MIVEKPPLPDDPTPSDAPPSYDYDLNRVARDSKALPRINPSPSPSSSSTSTPTPIRSRPQPPSSTGSASSSSKGKGPAAWFGFNNSRTTREVRTTVLNLVRDLVRLGPSSSSNSSAAFSILESCSDACRSYSLTLSTLLQEKSIENHTPLYWAIVKRPPDTEPGNEDDESSSPDLLTALLSFSAPLKKETISEVRHACLLTSDQALFQRLRLSPEFAPLSKTDEILLDATIPPDGISVEEVSGDEGSFAVDFEVVQFQKRMRVSKQIVLEFIARARMWRLAFVVASEQDYARTGGTLRPGTWCISLSLLDHSPPTWIDSRLLIAEPPSQPSSPPIPAPSPLITILDAPIPSSDSPPSPPRIQRTPSSSFGSGWRGEGSSFSNFGRRTDSNGAKGKKPKPTISLRLKSTTQLEPPVSGKDANIIMVGLEDSLMGASLQYAGNSYIAPDETLRARLEAKLAKPEADCVIC